MGESELQRIAGQLLALCDGLPEVRNGMDGYARWAQGVVDAVQGYGLRQFHPEVDGHCRRIEAMAAELVAQCHRVAEAVADAEEVGRMWVRTSIDEGTPQVAEPLRRVPGKEYYDARKGAWTTPEFNGPEQEPTGLSPAERMRRALVRNGDEVKDLADKIKDGSDNMQGLSGHAVIPSGPPPGADRLNDAEDNPILSAYVVAVLLWSLMRKVRDRDQKKRRG